MASSDIDRERVRELAAAGAQIVEVLPADEYEKAHLPGAINLPLTELDRPAAARLLSRDAPVVVYCYDQQ